MKNVNKTKFIVTVGVFSGIAIVLQYIGSIIPLKIGGFLELELSDLPALIISLAYGPLAGVACEFIKNLLHLIIFSGVPTAGVGELANFIMNGTMCLTAGLVYKYNRTFKGAVWALLAGTAAMIVMGVFANTFITLPIFMPSATAADRQSLVFKTILPFNIVRGLSISAITVLVYKKISRLIK